jgi:hypothetical protein
MILSCILLIGWIYLPSYHHTFLSLTGSEAKWYIEFPRGFFNNFNTLAMDFLTHYQLPIRYEIGTEILSSFKQSSSIHISDHIHEWRRRRRLIKVPLPDEHWLSGLPSHSLVL